MHDRFRRRQFEDAADIPIVKLNPDEILDTKFAGEQAAASHYTCARFLVRKPHAAFQWNTYILSFVLEFAPCEPPAHPFVASKSSLYEPPALRTALSGRAA